MDEKEGSSLILTSVMLVVLIAINGFFVAAEFAIVRVRGARIHALAKTGDKRAIVASHVLGHLDAYLSASQLGITIASILLGWVGERVMTPLVVGPILRWLNITTPFIAETISIVFGVGIITFLHVVFGEQAPKQLAISRPEGTTLWCGVPLRWFYKVMYPAITVLNKSANWIVRLVGIQPLTESDVTHSEEEMRLIIADSQRSGILTSSKRDLLDNVFDMSRRVVRQIMVPRTEISSFNLRRSLAENLAVAYETAHSRYPLVDGDLDHIVGVIHMKDLFWQLKEMEATGDASTNELLSGGSERGPDDASTNTPPTHNPAIAGGDFAAHPPATGAGFLRSIARKVPIVPETLHIDKLLTELQARHVHMAMVVDEYGGTAGMVTFENVIEEIVGEVQDEFDHEAPHIEKISDGEYAVEGRTDISELVDVIGLPLPTDEADTLSGLLLSELGKIPAVGDKLELEGIEFTVMEMRRQRIHRVRVKLTGKGGGSAAQ